MSETEPLIIKSMATREPITISPTLQTRLACVAILVAVGLERLACFSLTGNLIVFLTQSPLCFSEQLATDLQVVYNAAIYIVGLAGGWLSDSYFSRYSTIIAGYIVYFIGYLLLVITAYIAPSQLLSTGTGTAGQCSKIVTNLAPLVLYDDISPDLSFYCLAMATLFVIPVGTAVVNTNLSPFGGDQIRRGKDQAIQQFFNWYYFAVNTGTFIAYTGIAVIQQTSFATGYLVSLIALLLSFGAFLAGTKVYITRYSGNRDIVTRIFKAVNNARKVQPLEGRTCRCCTGCCCSNEDGLMFIDYADMDNGGEFTKDYVNDIKTIWRMCRVFLLMIPYWICYSQMFGSLFLLQGLHMNPDLSPNSTCYTHGKHNCSSISQLSGDGDCVYSQMELHPNNDGKPEVAATTLAMFNGLCIIAGLPLAYKLYHTLTTRKIEVKTWHRLTVGIFLAAASLTVAGGVETARLQDICDCGIQRIHKGQTLSYAAPSLSIWWQIPQYLLLGASEIFFIATGLEYTYMTAPMNMQGFMMGLFWFATGLGSILGLILPKIFSALHVWVESTDINCSRLDIFFYSLGGFLALFVAVFIPSSMYCNLHLDNVVVFQDSTPDLVRSRAATGEIGSDDGNQ